ncbi:MAG: ATP-binding cassette domain-containing protein, partial [Dehalococcoidia bacterium]|nr:ATP-binding cassette domain-containing protein [Dehalococcoidia bacterium]
CEAAQLHSLVESLPDGYQTVVGEMGYRLSGGERQRLAIARALLKRPRILIMDEPTSSLDSITERAIRRALASMRSEGSHPTTIVIAHRLSTILAADKILVLDEGRLVDSGRHAELLERCDLYRRLYEEQFASQMVEALV